MLEKVDRLADEDLNKYQEVVVTTKNGEVYVINRGSIIFPWSSDRPNVNVKLKVCRVNFKLSFQLLAQEETLGFFVSQSTVVSITAKRK